MVVQHGGCLKGAGCCICFRAYGENLFEQFPVCQVSLLPPRLQAGPDQQESLPRALCSMCALPTACSLRGLLEELIETKPQSVSRPCRVALESAARPRDSPHSCFARLEGFHASLAASTAILCLQRRGANVTYSIRSLGIAIHVSRILLRATWQPMEVARKV